MRFLIAAALVLCCSLCLAEDFPEDTRQIKSLTVEQAAKLVAKSRGGLFLPGLNAIDKDAAQELAKFEGKLYLSGLKSIDKDVALELAKFKGSVLHLGGVTSINKDVLKILKSNPKIQLPEKYSDKKD